MPSMKWPGSRVEKCFLILRGLSTWTWIPYSDENCKTAKRSQSHWQPTTIESDEKHLNFISWAERENSGTSKVIANKIHNFSTWKLVECGERCTRWLWVIETMSSAFRSEMLKMSFELCERLIHDFTTSFNFFCYDGYMSMIYPINVVHEQKFGML